ncbi:uncharacterized protein LOC108032966 [Drosophila biarmipes]|uniref:uncharacterized protein LOC108032966 n=1 Tax=Drosophila biarmipes TaxID=125945 RepID=UPI0021CC5F41|nr:uncharacterized protein LOC108032966 [Drosophila biarmipes]
MELELVGPELLLPALPPSASRQLVRRRSGRKESAATARSQRHRSAAPTSSSAPLSAPTSGAKRSRPPPPAGGNIAMVQPSSNTTSQSRRDRDAQRMPLVPRPPRQVLSARVLGLSNPYKEDQPAKERRSVAQRSRRPEVKTRNQFQYTQPQPQPPPTLRRPAPPPAAARKTRPCLRTVRAKVDSYLCPHLAGPPSPPPQRAQPTQFAHPLKKKSMAEAHQHLELLLSRIERSGDYQPPPPPADLARRRGGPKVAKGASRQMAQPPPVPAGSPMLSARGNYGGSRSYSRIAIGSAEDQGRDHLPHVVPLVQNPQCLPPEKRDALLELLQRTGQHDKGVVDIVASSTGDPSRDTMLMLLQMLPLSLDESPYREKFWEGHRYLKERQELRQKLRPGDERFKEVKVLRGPDGRMFFSRTLEEELKDEKKVLDYMEMELQKQGPGRHQSGGNFLGQSLDYHPLNERQEQAMRERMELEREKQLVINCREQRRHKDQLREQQSSWAAGGAPPQEQSPHLREIQSENATDPSPTDPWKQLVQDRNRFQAHCNRSCFYNNSRSSAPWKIYAKVASKLSSQLIESVDVEFYRSVANYVKDFVGYKCNNI